jgi:hypothetical protein
MLYSQILNPYPTFSEEREQVALKVLNEVLAGQKPSIRLNQYDNVLLQACKEVIKRKLKFDFDNDEEYWQSEYLKVLYHWLETIAYYDENGLWFLKNFSECTLDNYYREDFHDDFAMMNFDMNVGRMLDIANKESILMSLF